MENSKEMHGGDLLNLSNMSNRDIDSLLDFSVNVRPEGMPEFLKASFLRAINTCDRYPSPCAEEAKDAAADYFSISKNHFVFGNGSNEILHATLNLLAQDGYKTLCVFEPAFSEYSIAGKKAGMEEISIQMPLAKPHNLQNKIPLKNWNSFDNSIDYDEADLNKFITINYDYSVLDSDIDNIPSRSVIMVANPSNPSGMNVPLRICKEWVQRRKDCVWIFDEAFIDYITSDTQETALSLLSENCMVLRSLTKFYAIASIRAGYLACDTVFAEKLQKALPVWNVNGIALACILGIFGKNNRKHVLADAQKTRRLNAERRLHLYALLQDIEGICIYPSLGNFILFSLPNAPQNLWQKLLVEYGIILRNCSTYAGLETGNYFRAAVRFPHEHEQLVNAIKELCGQKTQQSKKKKTPALMLLGTSSNAGKSIITAAFCRIFTQDGYSVKPFKAQNMSLNSGVTALGDEMGRAQIVQAQAARVDPDARMNPILLKPHSDTGSQVILRGKALGHYHVQDYYAKKSELWKHVCTAYDELAQTCDIVVLEGAGSPAEVNLKEVDVVNIRMAQYAEASSLLVGDIDRGGIYASFLGTWLTFTPEEEKVLTGYLVNRFRGDATLLSPAHDYLLQHTGKPVLGVIPYIRDLKIPEEDMAGSIWSQSDKNAQPEQYDIPKEGKDRKLDIAIIQLAHISNHTDFEPLGVEPQCSIRSIRTLEDWGNPDIVILPGSKSVTSDLSKLLESGLAKKVQEHAEDKWLLGVCGGLQIMGMYIYDPLCVESKENVVKGLGLMNISSEFAQEKILTNIQGVKSPLGVTLSGYEIHHGISKIMTGDNLTTIQNTTKDKENTYTELDATKNVEESFWHEGQACGYYGTRRWATYVHGLFDEDMFRHAFLDFVRHDIGLNPMMHRGEYDIEKAFDTLADIVRENVDMDVIYESMGIEHQKRSK